MVMVLLKKHINKQKQELIAVVNKLPVQQCLVLGIMPVEIILQFLVVIIYQLNMIQLYLVIVIKHRLLMQLHSELVILH